jgi:hypothetical protein
MAMAITPDELDEAGHGFLEENHLASLTTSFPDGRLHVVPVAPIWVPDERTIRIVTRVGSVKVRNADRGAEGVVSMVDRGRWMSLHGPTAVRREPERVADTVARYTAQRHPPRGDVERVSLEVHVELIRGRWR